MTDRPGILIIAVHGTELRVGLLFPAMVLWLCLYGSGRMAGLCLAASLWHECGHLAALYAVKLRPDAVCLGGFGMRILLPRQTRISYPRQAAVALAGPVLSGLSAGVLCALHRPEAAAVNGALCVLNLLPIRPLDGGQALLSGLRRRLAPETADRILAGTSAAVLLPLTACAVWLLCTEGYNASLLFVCLYLILLLLFQNKD